MDKPLIEKLKDNTPSMDNIKEGASGLAKNTSDALQGVGKSLNEAKDGLKSSLSDFSNKSVVDAGSDFLNSNSLLAKFAFIILVFLVFMIVLKVMMTVIGYFMSPRNDPYLIKGTIRGSDTATITQAPGKDTTIPILRSNDRHRGLEFTWSSWLFLNEPNGVSTKRENIFVKGADSYDASGISISNGPGMYVMAVDATDAYQYKLEFVMDTIDGGESIADGDLDGGRDTVEVDNLPIEKWFHVAMRMQNMILDVYVNGTIVKRHNMDYIPKQNSHDIHVSGNEGFHGTVSDLRYFARALNVFEINNIVMRGPNLKASKLSVESKTKSGNYSYLSNLWYNNAY
jgi:hypothetical protein